MDNRDTFIQAYWEFRKSIDFSSSGGMPDLNNLVWSLLMGIPSVPADDDDDPEAPLMAVDQRVAILKAIFVEVNKEEDDSFLDEALALYDEAGKVAKMLLEDASSLPEDF